MDPLSTLAVEEFDVVPDSKREIVVALGVTKSTPDSREEEPVEPWDEFPFLR